MGSLKNTFRVSRPINQNIVVGLILFCLPGIYTALTGLGAGGGKSSSGVVANQTNAILYGMFTLFACLGGTIVNLLRPRLSMMVGSLGYPLYIGGLWYYDRTGQTWFPLFGGAMLGVLCGILWTCAGMIAFSYAEEKEKGLFICMQWMIRAVGASTGAAISFGSTFTQTKASGVSTAVYVTFIAIQCCSLFLSAFLIIDPKNVVRDDGTHLAIFSPPTLSQELTALGKCFLDKRLIILLPAMLVCEMALALVSTINGFYFNLRTRSLNNLCFQIIQLLGPGLLIWVFDSKLIRSRKLRGLVAVGLMGAISIGACGGLYGWLHQVDYSSLTTSPATDWSDKQFASLFVIYLLFGWVYSGYQMTIEWVVSSLSNDPSVLAQYAGFERGMASFGMCISFIVAAQKVPQIGQLTLQFILYVLGIIGMSWVLIFHVKETNYFEEDNTIAPHHVEEEATIDGRITQEQLERELRKEKIASGKALSETTGVYEPQAESVEVTPVVKV